ncbi:hypothetical protein DV737_g4276, partial [Chaetothyriales sp. CBS 132003]
MLEVQRSSHFAQIANLVLIAVGIAAYARRAVNSPSGVMDFLLPASVILGSSISILTLQLGPPTALQALYEVCACCIWIEPLLHVSIDSDWTTGATAALYFVSLITTLGTPWSVAFSDDQAHPLSNAPCLPTLTLSWLDPVMAQATSKSLSSQDALPLDNQLSVHHGSASQASIRVQIHLGRGLAYLLWHNFTYDMLLSSVLALINIFTAFVQPFLLQAFLKNGEIIPVVGLFVMSLTAGASESHMKLHLRKVGLQLRSVLTVQLCDTCLNPNLPRESALDPAVLIEVDAVKVFEFVEQYHLLWMVPLQTLVSVAGMIILLGWQSVLVGFISPLLALLVLGNITSRIARCMAGVMQAKDARITLVSQVLKQAKQIKLAALQSLFWRRIDQRRAAELDQYKAVAVLNAWMVFVVYIVTPALVTLTFGTAIMLGRTLPSNVVFPALALCFNIARAAALLPRLFMFYQTGQISFKRVRDFLCSPSAQYSDMVGDTTSAGLIPRNSADFVMHSCSLSYSSDSKPILQKCSLLGPPNTLLVISGAVGCGKTLLMKSLIGEIRPITGHVDVWGPIAYTPQKPFLVSGTIRENILFGLPFDAAYYDQVLDAVMLRPDLARLSEGDATRLSGTTVTLSGGQKSRVALARAVYTRYKIMVFDDPLAALDPNVQAHVVKNVFGPQGILRDTLRIVTTSSTALISSADKLYNIQGGTLVEANPLPEAPMLVVEPPKAADIKIHATQAIKAGPKVGYGSVEISSPMSRSASGSETDLEEAPLLSKPVVSSDSSHVGDAPVEFQTYIRFMNLARSGGWFFVLLTAGASKALDVVAVYFLKLSSEQFEARGHSFALVYYSLCALSGGMLSVVFVLVAYFVCVFPSARSIHAQLTQGVLDSQFSFFDKVSLGQLLNRFTNDMNKIDSAVNASLISGVALCVTAVSSIVVIVVTTPMSIFYLLPISAAYFAVQAYYLHSCRQFRRLETLARGPILDLVGEMLSGSSVIRSFGQTLTFKDKAKDVIDDHIRVWSIFVSLDSWLILRLQLLSSIIQLLSAIMLIWMHAQASTIGMIMTYLIQITTQFNMYVQMRANLEADITSVERVWECAVSRPEEKVDNATALPIGWPSKPTIEFRSFSASHEKGLQPCLSKLEFVVQPGEHVAVVGRTGAGKSSLSLALLRALHTLPEGNIVIDGVDIGRIDQVDLRRSITLMPQEPAIFEGTIRDNLALDRDRADEQLREALECCRIHQILNIDSDRDPLDYFVTASGANLSAGQIQIIALARAILAKNRIVILDEATDAMDAATSSVIQNVIKQRFRNDTIITITHHMESALEHDKILVLEDGRVADFATPAELLKAKDSIFQQLVAESHGKSK